MELVEIVAKLSNVDDDLTIYATEPWTCESHAVLAYEPADGGIPAEAAAAHARYFIEVFIAKEFLDGWKETQRGRYTVRDECERLIQYAVSDA